MSAGDPAGRPNGPPVPRTPAARAARALVRLAGAFVPPGRRSEWLEEWDAEIWHQAHDGPGFGTGPALVARCLGAFPHAIWVRREEGGMDSVAQDVRFALRTIRRRPAFAAVVVLTLALGIGGNTAVFSVVDAVLLRPLPLPNVDRVVWVWGRMLDGVPTASVAPPDYRDFDENVDGLEELAAYSSFGERRVYRGGDRPVEIFGRFVSHDLLSVLGHEPALGRGFTEAETMGENPDVTMLSYGLWGRLFGFDPGVLGTDMVLGEASYTIVGVLPEGLDFPAGDADLWMPLTFGAEWYGNRAAHFLRPIGLLAEGADIGRAQSGFDAIAARLEAAYPETNTEWYPIVLDLQTVRVGSVRPALLMMLGAIGLVLLIACSNVMSLMLARASQRRGEVALRAALGASRGRIGRQLLTESLVLAGAAGALSVPVALGALGLLRRMQPGNVPRLDEAGLDWTVLAFTGVLSLAVGVAFGLAPAFGASGAPASGIVRSGRGRVGGGGRARDLLVGGEVALSFVLLVGAGLLARSFGELRRVDPGFDPTGTVAIPLSFEPDADAAEHAALLDGVLERVAAVPGVIAVGAATELPFTGMGGDTYVYAEGRPPAQIRSIENTALVRAVDEGYFRAIGATIASGRAFDRQDDRPAPPRTVINAALAERLFSGEAPLGRRIVAVLDTVTALEVVGVFDDVRQYSLAVPPRPEFFVSLRQSPRSGMMALVRGATPTPPVDAVREAIWAVDPTQPLARVISLPDLVEGSLAPGRFQALLLGAFSVLALLLAGIGTYGLLAERVGERRREIGVRMAMGARRSEVVSAVVRRGMAVAVVGITLGAVGAVGATRLLGALLFGVGPLDPAAFIAAPVFLLTVVLVASWLPARQAARIDPVRALREE